MADKVDTRNDNVEALKRRGRRRLVGAIALVLAAVIVLPMIFDSEPRQSPPPVSVRIPGEDATGFTPKVTPKSAPVAEPIKVKPEPKTEPKPESQAEPKPEPKPEAKAAEAPREVAAVERAKAEAALTGGQFIVPVGAFADPANVVEQLTQAKIPHYTEPIAIAKGTVMRVRAGPFATQGEAEKALEQVKGLGLKPGKIAQRN